VLWGSWEAGYFDAAIRRAAFFRRPIFYPMTSGSAWSAVDGYHHFDKEQLPVRRHGAVAVSQNLGGVLVVPVVNHMLKEASVPALWDRLEEVATEKLPTVQQALGFEKALRGVNRGGLIEEDAANIRVMPQYGGQQRPVTTAHVNDHARLVEWVGGSDQRAGLRCIARHGAVENDAGLRILRHVFKEPHSMHLLERGLAGLYAVEDLPPRHPPPRFPKHDRDGAHRVGCIGPEALGHRSQCEAPFLIFLEDAEQGKSQEHQRLADGHHLLFTFGS